MEDARRARDLIQESHRPESSSRSKEEALLLYERIKARDPRSAWTLGATLVGTEETIHVRHFAFAILLHVVRERYRSCPKDLTEEIKRVSQQLFFRVGNGKEEPYAIKSKCAQLLAEVARQDVESWGSLLGPLFDYSRSGPCQAECVALVFQRLPEEVVEGGNDLQASDKRELLSTLMASLSDVLNLLYHTLENHYATAVQSIQNGDPETGRLHVAAVIAGLRAVLAYASWAPVSSLYKHGILEACSYFLSMSEFQVPACAVIKEAASRKCAPGEAKEDHGSTIRRLFEISCAASGQSLFDASANEEFVVLLCDTLATLGVSHFVVLQEVESRALYLQQLLSIARHTSLDLSNTSLPAWNTILREAKLSPAILAMIPEGCPEALIEMAGKKLSIKADEDSLPNGFDDLEDFKEFFSVYKSRLLELIKHCSALQPEAAARACSLCVTKIQNDIEEGNVSLDTLVKDWDAVASFLESVCSAVPVEVLQHMSLNSAAATFDSILDQLLGLQVADSSLIAQHARCFESFGRIYASGSKRLPAVLEKLFSMLDCIPFEGGSGVPPLPPPRGWKESFLARQRCCVAIMHIAQAASEQLLPFLDALAGRIERLWQHGEVRIGERNILCEALLAVSVASTASKQAEALAWVLSPLRARWSERDVQQSLQSYQQFLQVYAGLPGAPPGRVGGQENRWIFYHELVLVERSIRRLVEKSPPELLHPFLPHYEWAIPQVLSLLSLVHHCWTIEGRSALAEVSESLSMSKAERLSALGAPTSAVAAAHKEEDDERGAGGDAPNNLREFFRGSRECCFQIISLMAGRLEGFFELKDMPLLFANAVLGDVQSMENRHLRMMIRTVITTLTKRCPLHCYSEWLGPILPPLHTHMHQRLQVLWQACEARLSGCHEQDPARMGPSVENEVLEERILRELTREYAGLLVLNIEQGGKGSIPASGARGMSDRTLDWMLVEHPHAVAAVLSSCCSMLCWPDSEAASRAILFCRTIVCYAEQDLRLQEFVGNIMNAALRALTVPSNSTLQAELLSLLRDIVIKASPENSLPLQILTTLPGVTEKDVNALLSSLLGTGSEREQRAKLKQFLLSSGGDLLKALPTFKSPSSHRLTQNKLVSVQDNNLKQDLEEDPTPLWFLA